MIRKQTSDFQEAFAKHEEVFRENIEKVKIWRDAFKEVANISGWELKNRNESQVIEDIVKEISSKLIPLKFENHKKFVGIDSRLKELMVLLDIRSNDVRMIGICGMGGIGKTTIARVVYDLLSCEFEGSSFLTDVRETCQKKGLISLQKQLLSELLKLTDNDIYNVHSGISIIGNRLRRKKVLLVIDDVVNVEQLESLADKHNWFGSGSRIIVTSRDKHLLITHGVDEVYKLEKLNDDEACQLFCRNAFKAHQLVKEYQQLLKRILKNADGLPLALKVLGSFLYGRTVEEWESALQRLKRDSMNEIMEILQISFDGLQETEKQIFLDIACFFKRREKDHVIKVLESCDFDPVIGIQVLVEKSLISILYDKYVWMHDLLQDLGQQIVKRESKELGKRSRLWEEADVCHMLSENTPLNNLKFMRFSHCKNLVRTPDFTGVPYLEELILEGCIRLCEIHPSLLLHKKIILLNLKDCTNLTTLPSKIAMESLRELILSGCSKLRIFPEIVGSMECLRRLLLDGTAVKELPLSVELLSGLVLLNLKDCKNLESLPSDIINGLKCLKTLNLSGCSKLENVPENLREVESLEELDISGTAVRQLGSSSFLPKNLKALSVRGCRRPQKSASWFLHFPINLIPRRSSNLMAPVLPSLLGLPFLKELDLSDCNIGEGEIPIGLCNLFSLEKLILSKNNFVSLPGTINLLSKLEYLKLEDCKRLVSLPELLPNKCRIRVDGCAALKSCKPERAEISAVKCMKLVTNNNWLFSVLKGFFEVESPTRLRFVVPGSKIPEWFKYKNEGSSITIIKPPNSYYNKNKLVGYVICSVFHVHKHPPVKARADLLNKTHGLFCGMKLDKINTCCNGMIGVFKEEPGQAVSDHLYVVYLSNGFLRRCRWNFESNHVELYFEPLDFLSTGLEVKRCGVHPVYVDEVEEFNQATKEWTRSKVWNLSESDYIFDVATTRVSKRSLVECAGAEASDEEPQPKRYKELE